MRKVGKPLLMIEYLNSAMRNDRDISFVNHWLKKRTAFRTRLSSGKD
jgi:hypothetical protein